MSFDSTASRVQIIVAVIGLVGVLGVALIANFENLFRSGTSRSPEESVSATSEDRAEAQPACSISGLVFDRESNEPLSAVLIRLYRDLENARPEELIRDAAITGPDGSFVADCRQIKAANFPLVIALSHPDWQVVRITGVRIRSAGEHTVNLPIRMSSGTVGNTETRLDRDLSVMFSIRKEGADRYVIGTVTNRTDRRIACARVLFEMMTSFEDRQRGETPRSLGFVHVDLRDIAPSEHRQYEVKMPRPAGIGLESVDACK